MQQGQRPLKVRHGRKGEPDEYYEYRVTAYAKIISQRIGTSPTWNVYLSAGDALRVYGFGFTEKAGLAIRQSRRRGAACLSRNGQPRSKMKPTVFIQVSGGVAEGEARGNVDVVTVDWDNYETETDLEQARDDLKAVRSLPNDMPSKQDAIAELERIIAKEDPHEGVECAYCGEKIGPDQGRSSCAGSMHETCSGGHRLECKECEEDSE